MSDELDTAARKLLLTSLRVRIKHLEKEVERLTAEGSLWADMNAAVADEHERAEAAEAEVAALTAENARLSEALIEARNPGIDMDDVRRTRAERAPE